MTASRFLRAAIPAALAFLAAAPLFAAPITPVVTLSTVADTSATLIPGGTGTFTSFNPGLRPVDPCISGSNIAFIGNGANGQQGVYSLVPPTPIAPIADLNAPIPGGSGNFNVFSNVALDGTSLAFVGGAFT